MVQFGILRSAFESGVLLPKDCYKFFGNLRKIAEDPELEENYDFWLEDKLKRNLGFLRYIKDDPSCYWMFHTIYRFFEFDELCVDRKLSEGVDQDVVVKKLWLGSGVENIRFFVSSETREIVCFGFDDRDFDILKEVMGGSGLDFDKLTFSNCNFDLSRLSEIKGLFNGWIDGLEVKSHRDGNFLDNNIVIPGRFDFLVGSTVSSFETYGIMLNELDARSIGEFIFEGPNVESLSLNFGVLDGVGFAANLITSSGESPRLKRFEVKDSNFDADSLCMCIDSGFLDECESVTLTGCYDLSLSAVVYMISQIELTHLKVDHVMKSRIKSLYNVQ